MQNTNKKNKMSLIHILFFNFAIWSHILTSNDKTKRAREDSQGRPTKTLKKANKKGKQKTLGESKLLFNSPQTLKHSHFEIPIPDSGNKKGKQKTLGEIKFLLDSPQTLKHLHFEIPIPDSATKGIAFP